MTAHTGRFLFLMLLVFLSLGAACLGSWWGWTMAIEQAGCPQFKRGAA